MKEVQGELNTALIVAVSIGVLAAFFFGYIWPALRYNFQSQSACKSATCNCDATKTINGLGPRFKKGDIDYCHCSYKGKPIECVYKG